MPRITVGRVVGTLVCLSVLFLNYRLDFGRASQESAVDDLAGRGPRVGEHFADFDLEEVGGGRVTSADLLGKPTVLVFARSLDWCPFTKSFVTELAASIGRQPEVNVLLVFAPNQVNTKAIRFLFDRGIAFRVALDQGRQLIERLGIANVTIRSRIETGVPYPAVFVLDAQGIVRFRDTRRNHRIWLAGSRIKEELDRLG